MSNSLTTPSQLEEYSAALPGQVTGRLTVALFCALLMACATHGGETFTAYGTIESRSYHINETLASVENYNFEVAVSNCYWDIKFFPTIVTNDSYEAKFDGENIYFIHNLSNSIESLKKAGKEVADNIATGLVVKNQVPHDPFAEGIGPVWLTYASSCYFKDRTNDDVEVMFSRSDDMIFLDQVVHQKAKWKLNGALTLPTNLDIINDGSVFSYRSLEHKYHVPYNNGFRIAQFEVLTTTNIEGFSFPASAVFKTFGTKEHGRTNSDLRVVFEHHISLTRTLVGAIIDDLPPQVPGITAVTESRFIGEKMNPFSYRCKNRMFTDSEVRKLAEYERGRRIPWITSRSFSGAPSLSATVERKKRIALAIILVTALLPTPVIIFLLIRSKNKTR